MSVYEQQHQKCLLTIAKFWNHCKISIAKNTILNTFIFYIITVVFLNKSLLGINFAGIKCFLLHGVWKNSYTSTDR